MGIQFEAFVVCEKTGRLVPTGYVLKQDRIEASPKPADDFSFKCPACEEMHTWSLDDATVRLVAR
ncbi:MAG: hypothetical protein KIT60_13575 [Burkholderiaceae bacterium]|nr:hypothetical protein [Burkholderiaceae bacterium]